MVGGTNAVQFLTTVKFSPDVGVGGADPAGQTLSFAEELPNGSRIWTVSHRVVVPLTMIGPTTQVNTVLLELRIPPPPTPFSQPVVVRPPPLAAAWLKTALPPVMVSNSSVVPLLNCDPLAVVKTSVQSVTFVAPDEAPAKDGVQDLVTVTPVIGLVCVGGMSGFGGQTVILLRGRVVIVVPAVNDSTRSTSSQRLVGPMTTIGGRAQRKVTVVTPPLVVGGPTVAPAGHSVVNVPAAVGIAKVPDTLVVPEEHGLTLGVDGVFWFEGTCRTGTKHACVSSRMSVN
jgi:hypothetical protein